MATRVEVAGRHLSRARGLIGRKGLGPGCALMLEPARQIHTFGMRFAIDVAFCADDGEVLHLVRAMKPFRITRYVRSARRAFETDAGGLEDVLQGDVLQVR